MQARLSLCKFLAIRRVFGSRIVPQVNTAEQLNVLAHRTHVYTVDACQNALRISQNSFMLKCINQ